MSAVRGTRAALAALALAVAAAEAGAGSREFPQEPGLRACPASSGRRGPDALGAAIDALRDAAWTAGCAAARACAPALASLDQAFDASCAGDASRALAQSARAAQRLERAGLAAPPGPLSDSLWDLVDASEEGAAGAHGDLDAALARVCNGSRTQASQGQARIETALERARAAVEAGSAASALREFAIALGLIDAAAQRAEEAAARCWPRRCRGADPAVFRPGAAGNASLEIAPVDRATALWYRIAGDEIPGLGDLIGTLTLGHQGLSQARLNGVIYSSLLPSHFVWQGSFSAETCVDANGWARYAAVSERVELRSPSGGSREMSSSRALSPAAPGLPPAVLVPAVPQARVLRVGDEIELPRFALGGSVGGERVREECASSHRVVAIEEVEVQAGLERPRAFETARIESSLRCGDDAPVDWTTWLASGVGLVRLEVHDGASTLRYQLACVMREGEGFHPCPRVPLPLPGTDPRDPRVPGSPTIQLDPALAQRLRSQRGDVEYDQTAELSRLEEALGVPPAPERP